MSNRDAFVAIAKGRGVASRKAVVAALRELAKGEEPLATVQKRAVDEMVAAIGK